MLRWLNSDPVFWSIMLGAVILADAIGGWRAVTGPSGNGAALGGLSLATLAVFFQFLRAHQRR